MPRGAVPLAPQKAPTIKYDIKYVVRNDINANALAKFWISEHQISEPLH